MVRPDDPRRRLRTRDRGLLGRDIEEVAAVVPGQRYGPDRADIGLQRRRPGRPVHQVPGVPDDHAGIGVERRKGHVVVVAILEDGRIGMVARQNRIEEGAVAQIRLALALQAPAPGNGFRGLRGRLRPRRRTEQQGAKTNRFQSAATAGFIHVEPRTKDRKGRRSLNQAPGVQPVRPRRCNRGTGRCPADAALSAGRGHQYL